MLDFKLKIGFPSAAHADPKKSLPVSNGRFIIAGRVLDKVTDAGKDRKIDKIVVTVEHLMDGKPLGEPFAVAQKLSPLRPPVKNDNDSRFNWAIIITEGFKLDSGMLRLTISAFEKDNKVAVATDSVDMHVTAVDTKKSDKCLSGGPTIDWPDTNGYEITGDELSFFPVMGTSELALTTVHIGNNEAYHEWLEEFSLWWGIFYDLEVNPGLGPDYEMIVANADSEAKRIVDLVDDV